MIDPHKEWIQYPTGKIPKGEWCGHCGRFNSRYSTSNVIGMQGDKIVLVRRGIEPQKGFWSLPGGYLEWEETIEEGAVREFMEETGHAIYGLHLWRVYSDSRRDPDGRQNIGHCFAGIVGEKKQDPDREVVEVKLFSFDELPENIAFDHQRMMEDYRASLKIRQGHHEQRPWGDFDKFSENENSTVKIIAINPGKRLSLQSHAAREELWVALDDNAVAEIDGVKRALAAGELAYVPPNVQHRLAAKEKQARVLEIAFGAFDENDIRRYEDDFGRAG